MLCQPLCHWVALAATKRNSNSDAPFTCFCLHYQRHWNDIDMGQQEPARAACSSYDPYTVKLISPSKQAIKADHPSEASSEPRWRFMVGRYQVHPLSSMYCTSCCLATTVALFFCQFTHAQSSSSQLLAYTVPAGFPTSLVSSPPTSSEVSEIPLLKVQITDITFWRTSVSCVLHSTFPNSRGKLV